MKKKYVPSTKSGFRSWVNTVITLVVSNAAMWGIPPALVAQLVAMLAQFESLYASVDNKTLRSAAQVIAFETFRKEFTSDMRNLVQVHLLRNAQIPYVTKIVMNLNVRQEGNSNRPDIDSTPILVLANGNRGVIKFKLLVYDMGKRAKIHPEANGAELRFYITNPPTIVVPATPVQGDNGNRADGDSPMPIPTPVPAPMRGTVMETFITTRGSFDRKMEAYIGKAFVAQCRWINSTDESKNGTWSDFINIVIA